MKSIFPNKKKSSLLKVLVDEPLSNKNNRAILNPINSNGGQITRRKINT